MLTTDDILHDLERYVFDRVLATHPEKIALACARALFECLFLNFRKQRMYVPTSDKQAQHLRYEQIWREFNGRNHAELSIRYRLSVQQIYAITRLMRAAHVRDKQAQLFPLPETEETKPLALVVLTDYLPAELERAGLPADAAKRLALDLAAYLCASYPGVSLRITEAAWRQRQDMIGNLFDEAS